MISERELWTALYPADYGRNLIDTNTLKEAIIELLALRCRKQEDDEFMRQTGAELVKVAEEVRKLEDENDDQASMIVEYGNTVAELRGQLVEAQGERDGLTTLLSVYSQDVDKFQGEARDLKAKIAEVEAEHGEQMRAMRMFAKDLEIRLEEAEGRCSDMSVRWAQSEAALKLAKEETRQETNRSNNAALRAERNALALADERHNHDTTKRLLADQVQKRWKLQDALEQVANTECTNGKRFCRYCNNYVEEGHRDYCVVAPALLAVTAEPPSEASND